MKPYPTLLAAMLLLPGLASASGNSRIIATGGATAVEGAAGGGLVPWALLSGYGDRGEAGAVDGLVVGHGAEHGQLHLGEHRRPRAEIGGRLDGGREARPGPQRPAAGDLHQRVGAAGQLGADVLDQPLDRRPLPHDAREVLAADRRGAGEEHGLDPPHPLAPPQVLRQVCKLPIKDAFASRDVFTLNLFLLGCGRHGPIPYSRKVGRPVSSRATPSFTNRSQNRRAARPDRKDVSDAGATASRDRNKAKASSDPFARSFGATARKRAARRVRSEASRATCVTAVTTAR